MSAHEWRLIKSDTRTLSKKEYLPFAAKHAGLTNSPAERELDAKRVEWLEQIIRTGLAIPFFWAIVKFNGQEYRMNGRSSSTAIGKVGAEGPAHLAFHVDYYEADSREGMIELFRQFDHRKSLRSSADVAGAFQGFEAELVDCNRKLMKIAAEAISWQLRTVAGSDAPKGDDTYDLFHDSRFQSFYLWYNGITNGRKELLRKEVVAAMFATHEASETGATKFWSEVSYGPEFFSDDMAPGAVLINELSRALEDSEYREKGFPQAAFYYKKAVKAWNAFCASQRIASLNVTKGAKGNKGWPDASHYGQQEDAA